MLDNLSFFMCIYGWISLIYVHNTQIYSCIFMNCSMYTYMLAYLTTSTSSKCILHRIIYTHKKVYFLFFRILLQKRKTKELQVTLYCPLTPPVTKQSAHAITLHDTVESHKITTPGLVG